MTRHVDGLFGNGICNSGVYLPSHGQLDNLLHILKCRLAADFAGAHSKGLWRTVHGGQILRFYRPQTVNIDNSRCKARLCNIFNFMNVHGNTGDFPRHLCGVGHAAIIANHHRAAAVIQFLVCQGFYGNFWTVAIGIPHGNAQNRLLISHHRKPPVSWKSKFIHYKQRVSSSRQASAGSKYMEALSAGIRNVPFSSTAHPLLLYINSPRQLRPHSCCISFAFGLMQTSTLRSLPFLR